MRGEVPPRWLYAEMDTTSGTCSPRTSRYRGDKHFPKRRQLWGRLGINANASTLVFRGRFLSFSSEN